MQSNHNHGINQSHTNASIESGWQSDINANYKGIANCSGTAQQGKA